MKSGIMYFIASYEIDQVLTTDVHISPLRVIANTVLERSTTWYFF